MEVEQQVRSFIVDDIRWVGSPATLTPDYRLIDNDVLDSMAIFELIAFIEDKFQIQIDDDDLVPENFETIKAITLLVEGKKEQ